MDWLAGSPCSDSQASSPTPEFKSINSLALSLLYGPTLISIHAAAAVKSLELCPTLCDPIDRSPPGSPIPGILQARTLEWVAISFSRGSSQPRDRTQVSRIPGRRFNLWATREAPNKESWAPKNWCFWTVVLEKTLENSFDSKEIKLVNSKRNKSWIFIGRTAEAETTILWQPVMKNWLIGKDPDAGKDWRWEEKGTTEDEMVWWHHWLYGHGFEQSSIVGDGQGRLACCSLWGCKESDTTEWLNYWCAKDLYVLSHLNFAATWYGNKFYYLNVAADEIEA